MRIRGELTKDWIKARLFFNHKDLAASTSACLSVFLVRNFACLEYDDLGYCARVHMVFVVNEAVACTKLYSVRPYVDE